MRSSPGTSDAGSEQVEREVALTKVVQLLHSPAHTKFLKPWLYTYAGNFIYVIGQTDDRELRSMTLTSLVFQCGFTAGSTGYSLQAWLNFSHI